MKNETTNTIAIPATSCSGKKAAAEGAFAKSKCTESFFSRKIGNTTYRVSVSFSEKSNESIEDKILRLVAHENQQGEMLKCN